jgi:hypothetical protein
MTEKRKPKPYRANWRWGILNPWGDLWSPETFQTEKQARAYADREVARLPGSDPAKFKPVRVRVTVSVLPESPTHDR